MRNGFFRKGLIIGIIILFIGVSFSSAVTIKVVKLNDNDIINSGIVESTEDLPNLKIMNIDAETRIGGEGNPYPFLSTHVRIKNIGSGSIYDFVKLQIVIYSGIGPFSRNSTLRADNILLNLAPGQSTVYGLTGDLQGFYTKFVATVNYDKNINETIYHDNVAIQKFLRSFPDFSSIWTKIGPIYYPLMTSLKLGKEPTVSFPEIFGKTNVYDGPKGLCLNNPPDPPIINGPTNGKVGEKLTYCTSPIVDSDNDSMYIFWNWGDEETHGWIGPYAPGEVICDSHMWDYYGTYVIRAKLMDDSVAESDWGELTVTITKDKAVNFNYLLLKQLDTYPILQKIIQRLEI
jgi:hypothetical protein